MLILNQPKNYKMIQKHHFNPIRGVKFTTKAGKFISQGIWSNETFDFANVVTGKHHNYTIQEFNEAVDDGKILIEL